MTYAKRAILSLTALVAPVVPQDEVGRPEGIKGAIINLQIKGGRICLPRDTC